MVRINLLIILLVLPWIASAQEHRFMVFFTDKNSTPYTVDQPQAFLSQKAVDRRIKNNIAVSVEDLPVDPQYVNGLKANGIDVFYTSRWFNGALIQTDSSNISSINNLSYVSGVEYIAPGSRLVKNGRVSSENRVSGHTNLSNGNQLDVLGVTTIQHEGYYGDGVFMAFFDSGFEGLTTLNAFSHLQSGNQIKYTYNFVVNSTNVDNTRDHGTRVISTVAAIVPSEYQGIAPNADFMFCVTEDFQNEYRIEEYNWLIAAEKADSAGVDIISSSLGYNPFFSDPDMNYPFSDLDGNTTVITRAANLAFDKGMLVFASIGNDADPLNTSGPWEELTAPADAFEVISVGSIKPDGTISSFSSRGSTADGRIKPELVAMGEGAVLINGLGNYVSTSGTSFAVPQVAGLAALLLQKEPGLTASALRENLLSMGNNRESPNNIYGYGVPNYNVTLGLPNNQNDRNFQILNNPVTDHALQVSFSPELAGKPIAIYNATGQQLIQTSLPFNDALFNQSMAGWAPGLYILQVGGSSTQQAKFIIR